MYALNLLYDKKATKLRHMLNDASLLFHFIYHNNEG